MLNISCDSRRAVIRAYAVVKMCRTNETLVPYTTLIDYVERYAALVDDVGHIPHSLMFTNLRTLRCADSYNFQAVVDAVEYLVTNADASLAEWYAAVDKNLHNSVNDSATWSLIFGHGVNVSHWCNRTYVTAPYSLDEVRDWAERNTPSCIAARCEAVVKYLGDAFDPYAFDTTFVNAIYSVVKADDSAVDAFRLLRNHLNYLTHVVCLCEELDARICVVSDDIVDMLTLE